MTRLAQSLCLFSAGSADIWSAPADQEVNIILSWLTDLCLLDLMRKHISVLKNRKYSIYLLPWSKTLGPRRPDILQIVSQHPHSNLGPSHWPHHQQLQGPGDLKGRSRPSPEDRFHTWTFKTSSWLSGGSCHVTMVEVEWWLLRPKSGLWGRPDGFPGDIVSVESSLSTPIVAKDGRVLVKLIGDQQILLENLQIKVQLTAVVLLHGH